MVKKKTVFSRILSAAMWVVIAALCVIIAYIFYSNVVGKAPTIFGYTVFNVVTPSMEPTIKTGTYIIVKETEPSELKKDDIISFYSDNNDFTKDQPLTHRIFEVKNNGGVYSFITKGDANVVPDSAPVTEEKIIGRYYKSIGFLSGVGKILTNQYFYFIIVLIPAGIFLAFKIRGVVKEAKRMDDSDDDSVRKDDES